MSQNKINKGIGFGKSRVASPRRLAFLSLLSSSVFAAFLLMACAGERTIVQTVIVEKEIWVEVPGERVVETVVVEKEVIVEKLVDRSVVQTVVVERQVVVEKEVDRPVVVEKEVEVPVSVVVEKEVLVEKVVEVPVTVVVEKEVVVEVAVPETVIVEKEVVAEEEVEASATVVVEKEVVAPTTVVEKEVVEAQPSATPTPAPTPIPSTNTIKEASQTFQGSISADDDVDEYTFFQDAYGPVEISVSDIPLATPGSTHRLRVCFGGYDCRTFEDGERYVWRQVKEDGYKIRVSSSSNEDSFPYTIRVTSTKDDFAETREVARVLSSGKPFSDAIRPDGDVDYFGIVQESDGPVEISVSDIPLAAPGSSHSLRICFGGYDCRNFDDGERYVWRQVPRDSYTIYVRSSSAYDSFPYTIRVTTAKDDFAETREDARVLTPGKPFSDAIRPDGDVDYFGIVQESDGPVEISVSDIPLADPGSSHSLRICFGGYDCRNFDDGERYVWRQVPRDSYTIYVRSSSAYDSFPYTIRVTTAKDDFAETRDAASVLSSGQPFSDAIRPDGDVDYFGIVQESDGPVEISVSGIPLVDPDSPHRLRICFGGYDCRNFDDGEQYEWRQVPRDSYTIYVRSASAYDSFPYTIRVTFNSK